MRNKNWILVSILLLHSLSVYAQGVDESAAASRYEAYAGKTSMGPNIVASTSWVGAIVEAAGAEKVLVLAPIELRHPPEYDFSPQDIMQASKADLVFWAGYEGFVRNLIQAAEIPETDLVKVNTNNAPPQLIDSVKSVAQLLGTTEKFEQWQKIIENLDNRLTQGALNLQTHTTKAAVQFHQQAFAQYLGYEIIAVFGPQEMTMNELSKIDASDPDIIIDNWHSPQGLPLQKEGRSYVQLINFPGPFETYSLLDVLQYNGNLLGILQ